MLSAPLSSETGIPSYRTLLLENCFQLHILRSNWLSIQNVSHVYRRWAGFTLSPQYTISSKEAGEPSCRRLRTMGLGIAAHLLGAPLEIYSMTGFSICSHTLSRCRTSGYFITRTPGRPPKQSRRQGYLYVWHNCTSNQRCTAFENWTLLISAVLLASYAFYCMLTS